MSYPLFTLMMLNKLTQSLDELQEAIDLFREDTPTNHYVQLELDRHQSDIDKKRVEIKLTMISISSQN